jgi:peptidyl-prolyl cis-trans isomerase B (cyclophilin B)
MIQGGDPNSKDSDPNNDGMGGPGYLIDAELSTGHKHKQGALAAARTNNPEKKSSGSQFYIVENKEGTAFLDGQYTVFGETLKGTDVVEKIAEQDKDGRDRPLKDIKINMKVVKIKRKSVSKTYGYHY